MNLNEIKLELPNYKELDAIRTIKIYDGNKESIIGELDEETTQLLVNYAKENFLTIEEALLEIVGKKVKIDLAKEIIKHPIKSFRTYKQLKEERK